RLGQRLVLLVGEQQDRGNVHDLVGLETSLWVLAAMGFARGLAMGFVFIAIQTSVYATVSIADTARAASVFNTQRQVAYASGAALGATVLTGGLQGLSDSAPLVDQLPPYQWAFLAVGVVMLPAVLTARWIRDDDVAATRAPVTTGGR
ncbi:MAG: hypothetical protein RLN74_14065, partial [Ilumatobacter fluminis]